MLHRTTADFDSRTAMRASSIQRPPATPPTLACCTRRCLARWTTRPLHISASTKPSTPATVQATHTS